MNVHDELSPHTTLPFWVTNAENIEVVRVTPEGDVTVSPKATTEQVRWALEAVTRMLLRAPASGAGATTPHDQYQDRYTSHAAAVAGHAKAVRIAKGEEQPE